MSRTLFLVFNHTLTERQKKDAVSELEVTGFRELPESLKILWGSVPPDLRAIKAFLEPMKTWLKTNADTGDYVLIQGDFGAVYCLVTFAFENKLIPVYSTTKRQAVERTGDDGTILTEHRIRHIIFREYGR